MMLLDASPVYCQVLLFILNNAITFINYVFIEDFIFIEYAYMCAAL